MYETENKKNMRGICDYCIIAIYYYHIYEWEKHRGKSRRKNGYIKVKTESGTKEVPLKEYCIGTLAKEISVDFEEEALKAQDCHCSDNYL